MPTATRTMKRNAARKMRYRQNGPSWNTMMTMIILLFLSSSSRSFQCHRSVLSFDSNQATKIRTTGTTKQSLLLMNNMYEREQEQVSSRRYFLNRIGRVSSGSSMIGIMLTSGDNAVAIPFFNGQDKERRQLELCLVNVLRLSYWAQTIAYTLDESRNDDDVMITDDAKATNETTTTTDTKTFTEEDRKKAYLEARLGAKAIVAEKNKFGAGATARVFALSGLQIRDCLDDLYYYYTTNNNNSNKTKKRVRSSTIDQYRIDLLEALASIVEFDGLETTQDPSPRSSLTMGMYNAQKAIFVKRMLSERIVPLIDNIIHLFDDGIIQQCVGYIEQYYPTELPPSKTITSLSSSSSSLTSQ